MLRRGVCACTFRVQILPRCAYCVLQVKEKLLHIAAVASLRLAVKVEEEDEVCVLGGMLAASLHKRPGPLKWRSSGEKSLTSWDLSCPFLRLTGPWGPSFFLHRPPKTEEHS